MGTAVFAGALHLALPRDTALFRQRNFDGMPRLAAAQKLRVSLQASQAALEDRLGHLDDLSGDLAVSRREAKALLLLDGRVDKLQESHMFVVYIAAQRKLACAKYNSEHQAALQAHKLGR